MEVSNSVYFIFNLNGGGNRVTILADKNLLASKSRVFNAMFYGALAETGDVKIVDVSPGAFREFLQIFQNDPAQLTMALY